MREKEKSDNIERKHNKSGGDNIIIKIKGYFFAFIRDITKNNFINETLYFRKLPYEYISKLSNKYNVRLMNMQMKDILSEINFKINLLLKNYIKKKKKKKLFKYLI